MKLALPTLLACLIAAPAWAQWKEEPRVPEAVRKLAMDGHELVHSGKNEPALAKFRQAWAGGSRSALLSYNAACAAARLGRGDEAFEWLQRVLESGWDDVAYLQKDEDLASIRGDARFAEVVEVMKAAAARADAAIADKPLRDELIRRVAEDQQARKALIDDGFKSEALKQRLAEVDARNLAWVKALVEARGWPGRKLVGEKGSGAAFLLVQHADRDRELQKRCLPLLEKAVKAGDAAPRFLAFLTDRVRLADGKPQVYGTQFMSAANGAQVPHPIEDAEHVDERRAAVGLPPIAEYARILRRAYKPRPETPTADPPGGEKK